MTTIRPNFFVIGAPKSGTTSLSDYLKDHKNVYFSTIKEPQYFDWDHAKRLKMSWNLYLSLFAGADPKIHQAIGEGSTGYLISKVAVPEILKINPDSKFIVMLRNPVEMVQSLHTQKYFEGIENVPDFEAAWRLEGPRRRGESIPGACWEPKHLLYSEWAKYGEQIERLFSNADRARVKVLIYNDFVANPRGVFEETLVFLGLTPDGRSDFPVINSARRVRWPWLQRSLALSGNYLRRVRSVSGFKLAMGHGWLSNLMLWNSKQMPRTPISPALAAEIADFYREDVRKLSGLLDRDLMHWVSEPLGKQK